MKIIICILACKDDFLNKMRKLIYFFTFFKTDLAITCFMQTLRENIINFIGNGNVGEEYI